MINNLVFSMNTALPIFLVMLVGFGLKKGGIIDESFVKTANIFVFYVALPIKLFYDVSQTNFLEAFDGRLLSFLIAATLGGIVISWLMGKTVTKNPAQLGAFIHGCYRGNFIYIGFSLMENITGSLHPKVPIVAAVMVPLYNILGVMILSYTATAPNAVDRIRKTVVSIFRNPMVLSIGAGILASLVSLPIPLFLARTMGYFSALTTPLALVAIGASFVLGKSMTSLKPSLTASLMKLIILPMAAVMAAIYWGFQGDDLLLVYVLFGVPTATTSYIMTVALKGDSEMAANIIMITTALSVITMTIYVFVFKSMGII